MVIHSIVYVWEKFQIFSMCFTICFELKDVWANFGKLFLGTDGGLARPYKSIYRGGRLRRPPLQMDFHGRAGASPALQIIFQNSSETSFNAK